MLAPERSSIAIWSGSQQQPVVVAPGAEHMRHLAGAGGVAEVDQHMALLRHDHRGHGREQRGVGGQPAITPGTHRRTSRSGDPAGEILRGQVRALLPLHLGNVDGHQPTAHGQTGHVHHWHPGRIPAPCGSGG